MPPKFIRILLDLNRNSSEMPYWMDQRKCTTNKFNKGRPDHQQQREDSSETQPWWKRQVEKRAKNHGCCQSNKTQGGTQSQMYIILKKISASTISLLSTKKVGNFLSFDVRAAVQQRENSTLIPVPIESYLQFKMASLFSTDLGRVACSLDKYNTPPPQSIPLFPPLPYWTLLHLGPPLLVLSSLRAWSIDQFFVQKQKLKIDRNIQFLIFFLNSCHCS